MCMCVYVCVQVDLKSDVLCSLAAEINVRSIDSVSAVLYMHTAVDSICPCNEA